MFERRDAGELSQALDRGKARVTGARRGSACHSQPQRQARGWHNQRVLVDDLLPTDDFSDAVAILVVADPSTMCGAIRADHLRTLGASGGSPRRRSPRTSRGEG
jgi:hypothetical protein